MNCGLCLSMILGWEFPMQGTNVSSKNYWSWMIVENLVCIKQKYTANSQNESAEEHKRKVVVTILYNSGEVSPSTASCLVGGLDALSLWSSDSPDQLPLLETESYSAPAATELPEWSSVSSVLRKRLLR